jgi:uncharacterized iron-regulated protein
MARAALVPVLFAALAACSSAAAPVAATPENLAQAMARQPIVLLGEVHDNAAQHALRLQALLRLVAGGARPALAFEQLDADRQAALDEARRAPADAAQEAPTIAERVSRIIAVAGAKGWHWDYYRPYLAVALEHDLPIVAANLSRTQAMRIAQEGAGAVFDPAQQAELGLDQIAPDIERAQEHEIEVGHCGRLPADALGPIALAQVARDAMLARSIMPYAQSGVVLFTGNGHARRDIGVLRHLAARDQARSVSIGLIEDDARAADSAGRFDVTLLTPIQERADPCLDMPSLPGMTPHGPAPQPEEEPPGMLRTSLKA